MSPPRALAAALLALAGCVSLGPRPPPPRLYVLTAGPGGAPASDAPRPVLGLGPVELPRYLDRPQIVTRVGPTRLELASADRWAEPLGEMLARTLADDLRATGSIGEVRRWPWAGGAAPDWRMAVRIERFEREPDGAAVLEARWDLYPGGGGPPVASGQTRARQPSAGPEMAASVEALSRTLAALARDLADAVARAPAPPHRP